MTPRITSALRFALPLVAVTLMGTGCELLDQLQMRTGMVDVYSASHANPDEAGDMPANTSSQLIFNTDMGWQVFIDEAYVTTAAVTLQSCAGDRFDVDLYWGPLVEDVQTTARGQIDSLGGVRAESGSYCEAIVDYAPSTDEYENPDAAGSTVYLRGSAVKDGELVEFVWRTEIAVEVAVDLSKLEYGKPFHISRDQNFAKKISLSKDYCSFFMGVDFAEPLSQADIDDLIAASLDHGTIAKVVL